MTLITHFKNSYISVIAGDSRTHLSNVQKVFKISDAIFGFYGNCENSFYSWVLTSTDEAKKKTNITDLINKFQEGSKNLKDKRKAFSIVVSTLNNSFLLTSRYNKIINIPSKTNINDYDLETILRKELFLSPSRDEENPGFCLKHNNDLEELFRNCFFTIYKTEFDLNLIEDNNKLLDLVTLFFNTINDNPRYNNFGNIGGQGNYFVINIRSGEISEIRNRNI